MKRKELLEITKLLKNSGNEAIASKIEADVLKQGWLGVSVPDDLHTYAMKIAKTIDPSLLVEKGIEEETHVTLLFGVDYNDSTIKTVKEKITFPLVLRNDAVISYFDTEDQTVAKISITSGSMEHAHYLLKGLLPNKNKHIYTPHVTIAYLKPGSRITWKEKIPQITWSIDNILITNMGKNKKRISLKKPVMAGIKNETLTPVENSMKKGFNIYYFEKYGYGKPYQESFKYHGGGELPNVISRLNTFNIEPKSFLDIGCAYGLTLKEALKCGLKPTGIENSEYAIEHMSDEIKRFVYKGDARHWIKHIPGSYDIVLETVAQYIDESEVRRYLENACKKANYAIILITAYGNEIKDSLRMTDRPHSWWQKIMKDFGWETYNNGWVYYRIPKEEPMSKKENRFAISLYKNMLSYEAAISEDKEDYKPVICVDFDGVIHQYDGWKGADVFEEPIEGSQQAIKELQALGYRVILFTCRPDTPALRKWLSKNGFTLDGINTTKFNPEGSNGMKPVAEWYIDDNAVNFSKNWLNTINWIKMAKNRVKSDTVISITIPKIPIEGDEDLWNHAEDLILRNGMKQDDEKFTKRAVEVFRKLGGLERSVHIGKINPKDIVLSKKEILKILTTINNSGNKNLVSKIARSIKGKL